MATHVDGMTGVIGAGTNGKSRRGFASMDPARQKEIASKGGRAAHEKGTAHEWSSDEARSAGQKGGIAVSRDRTHMATIGREGGESRSRASRAARAAGSTGADRGFAERGLADRAPSDRELARSVSREGSREVGGEGRSSRGASLVDGRGSDEFDRARAG